MTTTTDTPSYPELVGRLSLEEKVALLTGSDVFTMAGSDKIGLARVNLSDGPTGVRGLKFSGGRQVTLFPNATLLSASWSTDTAFEVGGLLAEEAIIQDIQVVLGPTINLHRSVLGGRLFEAYSEDPLLTGRLAVAYVHGLQSAGIGACLKHLVANESETDRNTMNSVVDEKTLRELYLLPFEIAISESEPWSLMAAYNDVNGTAATEQQHVNNEIVKGEWGYDGLIMSDWYATKTAAPAANGGLDLVMPGPDGPWGDALVAAVRDGEVEESVVDDHVVRILRLADRVGAIGQRRERPTDLPAPDSATRRDQLTRLAAAGMTVLTNDGVLPLPAAGAKVALIGRHAIETIDMGGGSAQVNPPHQISVAEGLTAKLGDAVSVTDGVEVRTRPTPATDQLLTHPDSGRPGAAIDLYAADGTLLDSRTGVIAQTMVGFDDDLPQRATRVVFRGRAGVRGAVEVGGIGVGAWTVELGEQQDRFELAPTPGFGSELLAPPIQVVRMEVADGDLVQAEVELPSPNADNPMAGMGAYSLVFRQVSRPLAEILDRATSAAAAADIAVVVVGLTEENETEAVDKSTIVLPGDQDRLVHAVAGVAAKTVVVVNSATPVLMPWADEVDAIVWAGLPGQEGGHAVAAALLGEIEPAGRLVTTFPAAECAAPAWEVVPTDGDLVYAEGTAIGYRGHFAGTAPAPAFWLGHGLGYGTWAYGDAELISNASSPRPSGGTTPQTPRWVPVAGAPESPTVRVAVTNTGQRDSREVVQVYLQPRNDGEPVRLVGWTAVEVAAGETATVEVTTDSRLWRRWDTEADSWGAPLTGGELLVARGLGDIRSRIAAASTDGSS
jgi:beta-glucosidase